MNGMDGSGDQSGLKIKATTFGMGSVTVVKTMPCYHCLLCSMQPADSCCMSSFSLGSVPLFLEPGDGTVRSARSSELRRFRIKKKRAHDNDQLSFVSPGQRRRVYREGGIGRRTLRWVS